METNLLTENISLEFFDSIISGDITSDKLQQVSLTNVILHSKRLFLQNQNHISVFFNEKNISPNERSQYFKSLQIKDVSDLPKIEQIYLIHNAKKVEFSANEPTDGNDGLFNINLSLSYYKKEIEQAEIEITNSSLNLLSIEGKQGGKLKIEKSKIEKWHLHNYHANGEAIFRNIKPRSSQDNSGTIEIHECILDNAWFDGINFSEFKSVSFYRTRLGKARFTSCGFPADSTNYEKSYPDKKPDNYYKDQYETFLQLKNAMEADGNVYESQKLQAMAHNALNKIDDVTKCDKLILWINRVSNNHGLSIIWPLLWFLLFTIGFYILYLLSLDKISICNCNEAFDCSLVKYYFSFIDPTHKTDFLVDTTKYTFWSLAIDFFNKLCSAFFAYQFIAAFRKYGKR